MNMLRRAERGLEGLVTGAFARVFRSDVQPVEIAAALQRELDESGRVLSRERRLVPNRFAVALSPSDHDKLAPYRETLTDDLAATASEYAAGQGYVFPGPVSVVLNRDANLATGRFAVTSQVQRAAVDAGRPDQSAGSESSSSYHEERRRADRRARDAEPDYAEGGYEQPPGSFVPGFGPDGLGADPAGRSTGDTSQTRMLDAVSPQLPPRQAGSATPLAELHVHGGDRVPVDLPGAVIGRSTDVDVHVDDPGASRRHAEIRIVWNGERYEFWLVDLRSTNGTVVDGQRVPEARLQNGSRITVGATTLLLRIDTDRLGTG